MATLTGNTHNIIGVVTSGLRLVVKSLATSLVVDGSIIISGQKVYYTDSSGNFSLVLEAGNYDVTFNGTDKFRIAVPDDDDTHSFLSCVTSDVIQPGTIPGGAGWPSFPGGSEVVVTSDGRLMVRNTTTGKYHRFTLSGTDTEPVISVSTPGVSSP